MITRLPVDNPRAELQQLSRTMKLRRHWRYYVFYLVALLVFSILLQAQITRLADRVDRVDRRANSDASADSSAKAVDLSDLPPIELAPIQI